ncbi:Gfo/Idh/MocA family oxidoreductase [Puia dinghuensis]|uniref:Oxidoreductase n=1 Tax=Puia dinghuensis TaxID=1792502 RepID=A0A8J2UCQ1_9BACT|nr:Gfo/Idh/MocA family oxidoreductase [Puia dinghuensis]GGA99066.1 oxidoreductase [Puia dinghuensis]
MIPIKTAICSFGMSGRVFHAPFLHVNPGFEFYSVWEREKNLAQALYPNVKVVRTLEDLLADPAVELVIVNTPNYTHYDYAKKALLAGKHVIVEKPFTVTEAEGLELIALAKQTGNKISSYQSRRFDSDFRTVKRIVDEGVLGKLVEAEFHYDRYTPTLSPKVHKETPGAGRGLLYDLGSHMIDQALQLFGDPDAVFADIFIIRDNSKVDDYMEVLLFYPGFRCRIKSSYLVREPIPAYSLFGHKGTFLKNRTDVQERRLLAGELPVGDDWGEEPESEEGLLHTEIGGKIIRESVPTERGNYMDYFDGIYKAIRNNAPLPVTAEEATRIIRVIEKAYESVRTKQIVSYRTESGPDISVR